MELLQDDQRNFLDPRFEERSPGERVMVQLIRDCWASNPNDRPAIGAIIQRLQLALEELEQVNHAQTTTKTIPTTTSRIQRKKKLR